MSKYRIVQREGRYYAQRRLLGGFWVDLPSASCGGFGDWPNGGESPSVNVQLVENYIGMYRARFGGRVKVVREYD